MTPDSPLNLTFTKKKRSYEVPAPLAPVADTHAHLLNFWSKDPVETLVRAALAGDRLLITLLDPIADGLDVPTFHDRLTGWLVSAQTGIKGVRPLLCQFSCMMGYD